MSLRVLTPADRSRAYIALLWSFRRRPLAREVIRAHVWRLRNLDGKDQPWDLPANSFI